MGSFGSGNGQFVNPVGVAVDNSGHVYVTDSGNQRIQKFGPARLRSTAIPTATATLPATNAQINLRPDQPVSTPLTTSGGSRLYIQVAVGTVDQPTTLLLNQLDAPQSLPETLHFAGLS